MLLSVRQAAKSFGDSTALDGVDLEVVEGEWVGLLGPNGAGKTTLVRAIAGRVRLDGGAVEVRADGATGEPTGLGVVPQEVAIYPKLTARENLEVFASLYGVDRTAARDRVDWALEWTGLSTRSKDRAEGFSGGMKRRLNLACSVLHEPRLLLLDEPTVGVDPQSRERIWEMLGELRKRGTTLVLTTHQLDEAQDVCERIVILDHGRVIENGTLSDLIDRTIGRERKIEVRLDRALPDTPGDGLELDPSGRVVRTQSADAAAALQRLTARIRELGAEIEDVDIQSPTLQSVFLHLTGRELRE